MTRPDFSGYLKPNVVMEPLINQWYAWSYLIPPATAARYLTQSQLPIMESFVTAPEVHESALKDPAMQGGPFIQHPPSRVEEVRSLLEQLKTEQQPLIALSQAIVALEDQLAQHPPGESLEPLYQKLPAPLQGFVELVYDARNHPTIRFIEGLLYHSEFYQPGNQALELKLYADSDARGFVMSTPRLPEAESLHLKFPLADPRLDGLFRYRYQAGSVAELAELLKIADCDRNFFWTLFTPDPPRQSEPYTGDGVRVRYFGHACVLLETQDLSILCDPLISYEHLTDKERYSYLDLPETIDYALITHNHQDHVMLETLLQLRHRIRQIVIPSGQKGSLLDPSLKLALQQVGFSQVRPLDELEAIPLPDGEICSIPVLGEHGDLNIATKNAYWLTLKGRSIMLAADSNNLDPQLYQNLRHLLGDLDVLFIGMECDGAPFTWAYGPLLPPGISHQQAQTRRLDGSNAERGQQLVDLLNPDQVYVYAMGQEPWLTYITSIHYTPESTPIQESDRLVAYCRQHQRQSERLVGCRELHLTPTRATAQQNRHPIPIQTEISTLPTPKPQVTRAPQPSSATRMQNSQAQSVAADELTQLLQQLKTRDIRLWLDGETLRCNAPKGALTKDLAATLKEHKPAIIALLKGTGTQAPKKQASPQASAPASVSDTPDWERDRKLPPDLNPSSGEIPTGPPQNIFLTGATGFLGAFILVELIAQTNAIINCLVRAKNPPQAVAKLEETLRQYKLWQPEFRERITVIPGDLTQPHFGLSDQAFQDLTIRCDRIYHNGAQVHHLSPYAQLRPANVLGTLEVIRLACAGRPKPIHYTSTLSVFPPVPLPGRTHIAEDDLITDYPVPAGGYNRSKWVAEQLMTQICDRSLPVTIYRPGPLSGHSQTGAFNRNDFLYRLMQGYVQLGLAPDGQTPLDLLPVDYASKALVYLSLQPATTGKAFHLIHPESASSEGLFTACQQAGYPIERVPYSQWYAKLKHIAQADPTHPLYPLVALFASRSESSAAEPAPQIDIPFETINANTHLQNAPFPLPPLDQTLFDTYLRAMSESGVLKQPPALR
ncbi:MAG: thioester reductase domain-containing protein [Cyanobacteria bacterium P01_H01_bin.15]